MDPQYLNRLQEVQKKSISDTDVRIEQIKQFKEDYKALQDRLKTLPDKVTHDVMVPFGKLAFMPGQLVHTNEILVLLGDNWFVERSAKQAAEIADRRMKELDKKLKDLNAQQKLLEPRLSFTSDLQAEIQGRGDVKEILEEYEEAKEKMWDEQHRKNVRKYREELQRNLEVQKLQQTQEKNMKEKDSSLWSRLDELEEQETERREMDSVSDETDGGDSHREKSHSSIGSHNSSDRKVNWADEVKNDKNSEESDDTSDKDYTDDDDDDDDDADNEGNEEEADITCKPVQKTITFTHSPAASILPHQVNEAGDSVILSPADIYGLFTPKSILKKAADSSVSKSKDNADVNTSRLQSEQTVTDQGKVFSPSSDVESESNFLYQPHSQQTPASSSSANKAFTGFVVEKPATLPTTATSFTTDTSMSSGAAKSAPASTSGEHPKRVSKFKASRQNQNLS